MKFFGCFLEVWGEVLGRKQYLEIMFGDEKSIQKRVLCLFVIIVDHVSLDVLIFPYVFLVLGRCLGGSFREVLGRNKTF